MNTKRTLWRALGVIAISALISFAMTACENEARIVHDCNRDGHAWGEWVQTSPAACTTAGVQTRTCQYPTVNNLSCPHLPQQLDL